MREYYRMRLELLLRCLRGHGRDPDPGGLDIHGEAHYRAALASGRPVLLLGLHQGVVELLHQVPEAPPGRPFLIAAAPAFAPALTEWMRRGRERAGKRLCYPGGLGPALRRVLRERGVLALMADQGTARRSLRLWGALEVPCPLPLIGLALARGALAIPVSTRILGATGGSRFDFHPPLDADGPGGLEGALAAFLEGAIAAAPEQWNWSYPGLRPLVPATTRGRG